MIGNKMTRGNKRKYRSKAVREIGEINNLRESTNEIKAD